MVDDLAVTEDLGCFYCPACRPDVGPFVHPEGGRVWVERSCTHHSVATPGLDDARVGEAVYLNSAAPSGDEDSRRMCALLAG